MRQHVWTSLVILALASSLPCSAQVLKGSKPPVEKPPVERPPNENRLLLPSSAFAGGILTGYVMGPDNNPVPNAPVSINGGMLMGEVIGDPEKKGEKQPTTIGGPWIRPGEGSFGPEYGRPGLFTDWQNTALDFCKQGPQQVINPGPPGTAAGVNPGPPDKPSFQWAQAAGGSGASPQPGTEAYSPQWGGFTNAAGGFIICVRPGTKELQVSSGGDRPGAGSAVSVLVALDQPAAKGLYDPPFFCGRGQHFDLNGAFPRATAEQDGKVNEMAVAMALGPAGQALSTFECSNNLHPGAAKLSITDGTSHTREFQTHVFQFVDGALDRNQLMGGQPADFWYDIQMGPEQAGKSLCVQVTVAGPVVLTKPPEHKVTLNGDGRVRISGKIQATHVAPGSTVPFVISPHFEECGKANSGQAPENEHPAARTVPSVQPVGGNPEETAAYYARTQAPPTFEAWKKKYGIPARRPGEGLDAYRKRAGIVVYYNRNELGLGRELGCSTFPDVGPGGRTAPGVACYVSNYGQPFAGETSALQDAVAGTRPVSSYTHIYAPVSVSSGRATGRKQTPSSAVQFSAYDSGGNLTNWASLDAMGQRPVPQVCVSCHGGTYDARDHVVIGGVFTRLDTSTAVFSDVAGYTRADQAAAIAAVNRLMTSVPDGSTK